MDRENRQHSSGYRRPAAPYEQRESAWGQNPANGQGSTWSQQTYGNQSAGQGPVEAVRPNPTAKFRPYGESARQEGPSTNQTGEQAYGHLSANSRAMILIFFTSRAKMNCTKTLSGNGPTFIRF